MWLFMKMCQQGRRKMAKNVLDAYKRILPQKGLFHQLMHQVEVAYTVYYGSFLQAIQSAIGEKRISGEVIKNYQSHQNFMFKVYFACIRYTHRCFLKALSEHELVFQDDDTPSSFLARIRQRYNEFRESWERSPHEPSRVVLLFMKTAASIQRCKLGIRSKDFWLLEDESCAWMGPWKMCGKTTYLRQQCEKIELLYDNECMDPIQREVMRVNRIPVLSESEDGVTFDWVNELYNYWLKILPATPFIDTAVMRSRHTIVSKRCGNEIFQTRSSIRNAEGRTQHEDKLKIEMILTKACICTTHAVTPMTNDWFWLHCRKPKTSGSSIDKAKEKSEYTPSEESILNRLKSEKLEDYSEDTYVDGHNDDDDAVSINSSVAGDDVQTCLDIGNNADVEEVPCDQLC